MRTRVVPSLVTLVMLAGCTGISPRGIVPGVPGRVPGPADATACSVYVRNATRHELDVRFIVHGQRHREGSLGRLKPDRTASLQAPCMASVTAIGTAPAYSTTGNAVADDDGAAWIYLR